MTEPTTEPPTTASRNGLAIASLVLGIVAVAVVLLVGVAQLSGPLAIVGVVLGIIALRRWRRLGGHAVAHFGLWLSVIALLLSWVVTAGRM